MELERWRQVEELYHRALSVEASQRPRFLEESCPDGALLAEVESLLAYQTSAGDFIEATALDVAARLMARDEQQADTGLSGRTISNFHLLEKIGQGGMGVVYEALDTNLGRLVALKFLSARAAHNPRALERLQREARTASALNHPNICTIYSVQDLAGQPFMEMERLQGRTLRERIAGKPLDVDVVIELGLQMADGLDAAHAAGIVHRDLKPGNVFVTDRGLAKILDFGLAKLGRGAQPESEGTEPRGAAAAFSEGPLTDPGTLMGTAAYMSPEQALRQTVDSRTDLFSLGAVLYEMATGQPAFSGAAPAAILDAVSNRAPVPLRLSNPAIPASLERIITKALEKNLALRYQTASEIGADLSRLKRDRDPRSRRRPLSAAVAAATLLVAFAAFWYPRRQPAAFLEGSVRQLTHNSSEDGLDSGAISPDGSQLAYADRKGLHIRVNPTGETRTVPRPEGLGTRVVWDLSPGWLPDGKHFVANLRSDDTASARGSSVWIVSMLGAPRKLRENAGAFSVSPNGSWIAFGRDGNDWGDREVWRMTSDGEQAHKLYQAEGGSVTNVCWSPDGRRTAYLKGDESGSFHAIETRDLAGGPPSQILRVPETESLLGFIWLRDGRLLYSVGEVGASTNAGTLPCTHWQVRIDPLTTRAIDEPRRVANWLPQCVGPITVTADLKHAAFRQFAFQDVIYVASFDSTGARVTTPRRLTFDEGRNIPSGFSADGKSLVFVSDTSGTATVRRQSIDADTAEVIASEPGISGAARLSPDGAWVLYVVLVKGRSPAAGHRLMRVPLMGGRAHEVLSGNFVDGGARCAASPSSVCAIAERSSDGRQLVFTSFDPGLGRGRELARFDIDSGGDYKWALSPDASHLAILNAKGATIHVLSLAGLPPYQLDVKGWTSLGYMSWTADGKGLLVRSQEKRGAPLLSVDLQGKARILWQPEGSTAISGIPSLDGRQIAIWVRSNSANIWMTVLEIQPGAHDAADDRRDQDRSHLHLRRLERVRLVRSLLGSREPRHELDLAGADPGAGRERRPRCVRLEVPAHDIGRAARRRGRIRRRHLPAEVVRGPDLPRVRKHLLPRVRDLAGAAGRMKMRVTAGWALAVSVTAAVALEGRSDGLENSREAAKFRETKWTLIRSLKEIDADVLRSLKARFGRDDRIADQGEPFEMGEALTKLPPRRLLLAGRAGRRQFVAYEMGGREHRLVLTVWETGIPPRALLLARGQAEARTDGTQWELGVEDLREALQDHRLFLEDPAAPYY